MLPMLANAQFKLTKDGFVSEDGKEYYVCTVEGKTATELYNSVNAYVISNFKNPDVVANRAEGSMLNIHLIEENAIRIRKSSAMRADIDANMVFYFKDGRMRIDAPKINHIICMEYVRLGRSAEYVLNGMTYSEYGSVPIFKKDGTVKNEMAVNRLEGYFNGIVKEISEYVSQGKDSDW